MCWVDSISEDVTEFLLDVVQLHPVMLTQKRCLLVKEALQCQLTKPPSPSISQGSRRADLEIHYIINDHICVAFLQKGPHVAIYQSRENRS